MEKDLVEAFQSLFRGREDVWGSVEGKCNKEKVTLEHYKKHLEGDISLGIYPLFDDGTCQFFAIDIDEKDFDKVKAIRQELFNNFIPAYIAASKTKGYHIYGFAVERFVAKDIRIILHHILNKLNLKAEIFPKQDEISKLIPYGNYINLPCFGYTRPLLTADLLEVSLEVAIERIKYVPQESIERLLRTLPTEIPLIPKKVTGRQKKHPPCIETILRGVSEPGRDEAAFALARHYLDQYYLPEEVLGLLKIWDERNNPPLADEYVIKTKIRSAQKGYAFGCSSITDNPMLSKFCVGKDKCDWLKEVTKERKKKGLIKELSFFETETQLYEELFDGTKALFIAYNKETGEITYQTTIQMPEFTIVPIFSEELIEGAVTLPKGIEEYGNTVDLVESIKEHINEYVDLPDSFREFATWYIIMTWVFDRLSTVSYLRFTGDTGTGKSRSLDVIGRLCYKPLMMSGAVTPAPIYRLIRRFRGTMVLDEADFRESSEKAEVVTILNCGFERNRPIIRCSKDNPDHLEILPCFGPKVFATRFRFYDIALEARCLTHTMEETDRVDIPPLLGESYYQRENSLRSKLLLWRLRNCFKIDSRAVEDIDLGILEPRLKQTSLPYAVPFKDMPDVMERFKVFIKNYNAELIKERAESRQGRIIYSILLLAQQEGKNYISSATIANYMKEEFKIDISTGAVGRILKSLNVTTSRERVAGKQARYIKWDDRLMRKLLRRYVTEPEEFSELFQGKLKPEISIDMEF